MSRLSRRKLLKLGLGASQLALLDRFQLNPLRPGTAHAQAIQRPTKLMTIMVVGGWQPWYFFNPLRLDEVARFLPAPRQSSVVQEPLYCSRAQVEKNLDGTPAVDPPNPQDARPLRVPRLWDETALGAGQADRRQNHPATGLPTAPFGYAWAHPAWSLWENAVVVHGIDQGTPAHLAGRIAALCGYAGQEFAAPGVHAVVANAMLRRFPDRVVPSISLGNSLRSSRRGLPAEVDATSITSVGDLSLYLSENNGNWAGLTASTTNPQRNRQTKAQLSFAGGARPPAPTHPIDDFALAELRRMAGRTNAATDALLEKLHDGYLDVSRVLASDVVSAVSRTPDFEHTTAPYWAPNGLRFGLQSAGSIRNGFSGTDDFALALKLLKSNVTSSVAMSLRVPIPAGGGFFDSHGAEDYNWPWQFMTMEMIGRFVAELKFTPNPNGAGSLLDDTLIMLISDFSRTWPLQALSDHWPVTSVVYIGGQALQGNQMLGAYDVSAKPPSSDGFEGLPLAMRDEKGDRQIRRPKAHDSLFTAYRLLGIDRFMPDGPGEFLGLAREG